MNKVSLLCKLHAAMLEEFQQRTLSILRRHRISHIMIRPMQPFLELSTRCQIDKGRRIIEHAAGLVSTEKFPTRQDIQRLLTMSRNMDQVYITNGIIHPTRLVSQLPLIEPIRRQYIQFVMIETHLLLIQWQGMRCLRNALAIQYDIPQCSKLLYDMLHTIGLETRLLGYAVNVPVFARLMRETMSQTVYLAMESVARGLADDLAYRLFRSRP